VRKGTDLAPVLADVARLRIAVFRHWPYLYDGDMDYELRYLGTYQDQPEAVIVLAHDGARVVGASTGLPMELHADGFSAALDLAGLDPQDCFYCAESVLLPGYRGQGAGHRFFDLREAQARDLGRRWSVFCSVDRPEDHPARPADYRPLHGFWRKRGYAPVPGAFAHFDWRDIGEQAETTKPLQLWLRDLAG